MKYLTWPLALVSLACLALPIKGGDAPEPRRVLILQNETTLVGRIEPCDSGFQVRTDSGSSLIPRDRALQLCDSPEEAYEVLRQRLNRRDPAAGLRLARWCLKYNLNSQARQEAEAVLKLQPGNLEAQRIVRSFQADRPAAMAGEGTGEVKPSPAGTTAAGEEHNYSPETLKTFALRIQPMLVNSCAAGACHGGSRSPSFQLQRPPSQGAIQPNLTRHNLLQTVKLIDAEEPGQSLLLRKALEAHGGAAKPPLPGKDVPAYQTLEAWVRKATPARGPQPLTDEIVVSRSPESHPERTPPPAPSRAALPPALEEKFASLPDAPGKTSSEDAPATSPAEPAAPSTGPSPTGPTPDPADPFDPAAFNERYHRKK